MCHRSLIGNAIDHYLYTYIRYIVVYGNAYTCLRLRVRVLKHMLDEGA